MRRLPLSITTFALAGALLAACSGSSASEITPTHEAASPATAPATVAGALTAGPTATATATTAASATATTEASATTPPTAAATATTAPAEATQAPQPTQAPEPTPTPPPASSNPMSAAVSAAGTVRFIWSPSAVTIAPGGTVTWSWTEPVQPHNVAGTDFPLSSAVSKSGSASHTFTAPGVYHFVCEIHPDSMTGTVTVQ